MNLTSSTCSTQRWCYWTRRRCPKNRTPRKRPHPRPRRPTLSHEPFGVPSPYREPRSSLLPATSAPSSSGRQGLATRRLTITSDRSPGGACRPGGEPRPYDRDRAPHPAFSDRLLGSRPMGVGGGGTGGGSGRMRVVRTGCSRQVTTACRPHPLEDRHDGVSAQDAG